MLTFIVRHLENTRKLYRDNSWFTLKTKTKAHLKKRIKKCLRNMLTFIIRHLENTRKLYRDNSWFTLKTKTKAHWKKRIKKCMRNILTFIIRHFSIFRKKDIDQVVSLCYKMNTITNK
jgi:predicted secreted protein